MKSKDYSYKVVEMTIEIADKILEIVKNKKKINIRDVYLGEYDSFTEGYPEVQKLIWKDEKVWVITDVEEETLGKYNIEELICLLENIEK